MNSEEQARRILEKCWLTDKYRDVKRLAELLDQAKKEEKDDLLEGKLLLTADEYADSLNNAQQDQRDTCAKEIESHAILLDLFDSDIEALKDTCLNATGEDYDSR